MYWFCTDEYLIELKSKYTAVAGMALPDVVRKERDPIVVTDGIARVKISGVLVNKYDRWLGYWGEEQTVYGDIVADALKAKADGAKQVDFEIVNCPGGTAFGLFEAMTVIGNLGIKTRSIVSGMACSGGYMLASQTDQILAENVTTIFGSVGMATHAYISDRVVDITNTGSEQKRPNAATAEGVTVIKTELDDMFKPIVNLMSDKRNVSADQLLAKYGNGRIVTAGTGIEMGMVDGYISDGNNEITVDHPDTDVIECNENVTEPIGEEPMSEKNKVDTDKIIADAEKRAGINAVAAFMKANKNLTKSVMDIGVDVISGIVDAVEFYNAVADMETVAEATEQETAETENVDVSVSEQRPAKHERDPHVIHDLASFEANKADFRRH